MKEELWSEAKMMEEGTEVSGKAEGANNVVEEVGTAKQLLNPLRHPPAPQPLIDSCSVSVPD